MLHLWCFIHAQITQIVPKSSKEWRDHWFESNPLHSYFSSSNRKMGVWGAALLTWACGCELVEVRGAESPQWSAGAASSALLCAALRRTEDRLTAETCAKRRAEVGHRVRAAPFFSRTWRDAALFRLEYIYAHRISTSISLAGLFIALSPGLLALFFSSLTSDKAASARAGWWGYDVAQSAHRGPEGSLTLCRSPAGGAACSFSLMVVSCKNR